MKIVVLGTGMVGSAIVHELSKSNNNNISSILAVDAYQESLNKCLAKIDSNKVSGEVQSIDNHDVLVKILSNADIAIGCLPHSLSLPAIKATIEAKCHYIDLVGSKFLEKKELHEQAKEAGILIVPGCGVAPGIVNFLAARGIELLDEADEAVMMCGGIPKNPLPPLWYQVVFRLESVMGLYTRKPLATENGEVVELSPFSGLETLHFAEPVGECEAIYSDPHSVAYTLKDKVNRVYEKTIRYKGHFEKMKVLNELGFLNEEPIVVDDQQISPKEFTMALLEPQLQGGSHEDITVLRVTVKGKKQNETITYQWDMIDHYDHDRNITSMAKTTGFPAIIMTELFIDGKIDALGVIPPEEIVIGDLFDEFVNKLDKKNIKISFKEIK